MAEDMLTRAKNAQAFYKPRTKKIKQWYRFVRLVDELALEKTGNVETWVSASPRSYRTHSLHLLSAGKVRDRLPITIQSMSEREKMGDVERMIHSIWRERDAEQVLAGRPLWMREFCDFPFMTGWWAVYYGTFKDGNDPYFRADILNPAITFPMFAENKLVGCYIFDTLQENEIRLLAKVKGWKLEDEKIKHRKTVDILKGWERDGDTITYGVYVGDKAVINPEEKKEFRGEGIPIMTGPVGGFADRGTIPHDIEWIARMGESMLEPGRDVIQKRNRLRSFLQEIVKKIATTTVLDFTSGGKGALSPQDIGKIAHLKVGEDAKLLVPDATALPEINVLLGEDSTEWQLATLPAVAYGTTMGLELSGYAYSQMLTAAYASLGELNTVKNKVRGMIDKKWLDDFKKKWPKNYKLKISGEEVGEHAGFFTKEIGPADIPDFTYVDVDSQLAMPSDFFQRINAARVAVPEGPLMDFVTMAEDLMKFDDPELVLRRIGEDNMRNSVYMQQALLIFEMRKRAQEERKREGHDPEFPKLLEQIAQKMFDQIGMEAGGPSPRGAAGIRQEMLPAEMRGMGREQRPGYGTSRLR